jgi:HEAT repeat protein
MPYIPPDQYASASAYELLKAAEAGCIGFDQRLIHALVDQPDRTLPDILRFLSEDHDAELASDMVLLLHHLNPPEAVPIYIHLIRNYPNEVSDELAEAVAAAGERMLEPLLDLHAEIGEEDAGEIAFLLAGLGIRDPRILKVLVDELEYDAGHGALCLGLYGDPAAIPDLHRIMDEVDPSDKYLRHEIEQTIRQIQEAQGQPQQPEAFNIFSYYPEEQLPEFSAMSDDEVLALAISAPADVREGAVESFRGANLTP